MNFCADSVVLCCKSGSALYHHNKLSGLTEIPQGGSGETYRRRRRKAPGGVRETHKGNGETQDFGTDRGTDAQTEVHIEENSTILF